MGRTACTEPQCLYKGALYLFYCIVLFQNTGTLDVVRSSIRLYHEGPQNKTLPAYQFQKYHYDYLRSRCFSVSLPLSYYLLALTWWFIDGTPSVVCNMKSQVCGSVCEPKLKLRASKGQVSADVSTSLFIIWSALSHLVSPGLQ
jgi:hypothetical protein